MLKLIRDRLYGTFIDQNNFEEQILKTVEELGMLPPTGIYAATGEYDTVKNVLDYAEMDFYPEWEPEDE
jgi:hypothetical protein